MFEQLKNYKPDAIESTFVRAAADDRPGKVNLSIGVFRDASGNVPIMESVRRAEAKALRDRQSKGYLTPAGNPAYAAEMETLVLGSDHAVLKDKRIRSVQTPGAGAALRVAAELITSLTPRAKIWFDTPVWAHQHDFFTRAGMAIRFHPYYDRTRNQLDFDGYLKGLSAAKPGDIVVIHGCCHNPTGEDLSPAQWRELTAYLLEHDLIPLVDIAYQGYGDGLEADVAGARYMAEKMPTMMIATTSSKSFAVYRDRAGALMLIHPEGGHKADDVKLHTLDLIRGLYFMAPDQGAEAVTTILRDPELRKMWESELEAARLSVANLRQKTYQAFSAAMPEIDFSFIARQKGMFSCLPISEENRIRLERDKAIYLMPEGRINFAALTDESLDYVADSLVGYL